MTGIGPNCGLCNRPTCRLCFLWRTDRRYRAMWGGNPDEAVPAPPAAVSTPRVLVPPWTPSRAPPLSPTPPRIFPCAHEGQVIERCHRNSELAHVRDCDVHDRCTRGANRGDMMSCQWCPDFAARTPDLPPVTLPDSSNELGDTRHLLYHVLPVRGNGRWQRNVEQLREYIGLFNGLKLVAVMRDAGRQYQSGGPHPDGARVPLVLDPPEAVEAALAGTGCEFIRMDNDPNLREVASHGPLFSRLADVYRPNDVALWAHAKGVTRHHGHPAKRWTDVLCEAMLAYWPAVLGVLRTHPLAGCFKKLGRGWNANQSRSDWHYSGSWFWFRCRDLFARDWRRIDQFWSGIEPYASQHFDCAEAGVLFFEGQVPGLNLYNARYWDRIVHHEWVRWKVRNTTSRTDIGALQTSST